MRNPHKTAGIPNRPINQWMQEIFELRSRDTEVLQFLRSDQSFRDVCVRAAQPGAVFTCMLRTTVRSHAELTSDVTGQVLEPGESITIVEVAQNTGRQKRVRFKQSETCGWISVISSGGEIIIEPVVTQEPAETAVKGDGPGPAASLAQQAPIDMAVASGQWV